MIEIKATYHTGPRNGVEVDAKVKGRCSEIMHELSNAAATVLLQMSMNPHDRSVDPENVIDVSKEFLTETLTAIVSMLNHTTECDMNKSTRIDAGKIEQALKKFRGAAHE